MTRKSPVPDLSNPRFIADLVRGFGLPIRAFGLILTTPRLLLLGSISGLVTGAALVTMAIGLWPLSSTWSEQLVSGDSLWMKGAQIGLSVILYLLLFIVGALTVPNLLLAPLGDPISEATELSCGEYQSPPFAMRGLFHGTVASVAHTVLRLLLMLAGMAIIWPSNLVPFVGSGLWVVVSSLWSMFWLSVEHLSTPMARHLYGFPRVVSVLRQRLALALGFGGALGMLLWIPIVNFFLLPIAIVAGTLLFRGLLRIGALPPPAAKAAHQLQSR
jgi:CysZ protein